MSIRFTHVLHEVLAEPWMILPEKLAVIQELVEMRAAGQSLTREEIDARIGAKKADASVARKAGAIAVLPVQGVISRRISMMDDVSGGTSIEKLTQQFRAALNDPEVKAIVLDIDSPGGSVYGVDELASEIYSARGQKPIIAQVSPMAASAAYYLACPCDEIVMEPSSEVGSIGVFMGHTDVSKAMEAFGVKKTLISAGKYKTEGNPYEALTPEARDYMQSRVNDYYDAFVKMVARGRNVAQKDVRDGFGEGRMVGSAQALKMGMADRAGTMDDTLARLGAPAGASRIALQVSEERVLQETQGTETQITAIAEKKTEATMNEGTGAAQAVADVRKDMGAIVTLCGKFGMSDKAAGFIADGKSLAEVQAAILSGMTPAVIPQAGAEEVRATATPGVAVTEPRKEEGKGLMFARACKALCAVPKGDRRGAAKFAEEVLKDKYLAAALGASTGAGGGFIVPDQLSQELIEFLRPQAVVRSLNPTLAPLPNGSLTLPKLAGGASAGYVGENQNMSTTSETFGQVKLTAKKLTALVPISNDLVRYASIAADALVRDDMVAAIAQAEDQAFIRGAGSNYAPKGLRNWAAAANVIAANGTVSLANTDIDLGKLRLALRNANVRFLRMGWIIAPRIEQYLLVVKDSQGHYVYRDEMTKNKTIWGYPYRVTTLVPINLGGGTESEIYLADFADVVIGEVPTMVLEVSTEAAYFDGANVVSAFSLDQTVIKVIIEHDLAVRHAESVAVLTTVTWT